MKLGADNSKWTAAAVVLMLVALFLVSRTFFRGGSVSSASRPLRPAATPVPELPGTSTGVRRAAPARRSARRTPKKEQPAETSFTASLDPRLRLDLLAAAEKTTYAGSGRNIFRPEADPVIPKPVAPAMRPPTPVIAQPSGPPPPPPPPPINLKFFGFATSAGFPKKIFLSEGEDIFVAGEGDIVNRRYKIVHIGDNAVEVEDMLNNRRQSLPLTS